MAQGRLVPALCGQPEVRAGRPDRAPGRASRCEFAPCLQRGRGPNRASVPRPGGVHRHGDRRKMKANEIKICGLAAVRARFRRDASSIVRLYFDHPTSKKVGMMCRALAAARKVYRCVEPSELEKIADSVHHGGIVAVVEDRLPRAPTPADIASWVRRHENVVALDRIGNAHNLGAPWSIQSTATRPLSPAILAPHPPSPLC